MRVGDFFNPIYAVNTDSNTGRFCGNAFPVTPNGGLLTCRHVVEPLNESEILFVHDDVVREPLRVLEVVLPANRSLDLAFLPRALSRPKQQFFPIIEPSEVVLGVDVFTHGYYCLSSREEDIAQAYFKGSIVDIVVDSNVYTISLPFPLLEGMSGSPLLTYFNGTKLAGVCYGNHSQRLVASEVIEYRDTEREIRETITRIVEFGQAYHPLSMIEFLREAQAEGFVVTNQRCDIESLE